MPTTKKIVRTKLYSVNNPNLKIEFQRSIGERGVVTEAGTIKKELGNTKDVLFVTDDRRGELPFIRRNENGTVDFGYTVDYQDMPQLIATRNKINQLAEILKQGSGQDIDELVRFEYELPNDLPLDVNTVQGQHKRFCKVIDIKDVDRGDMSDTGRFQGGTNRYVGEIRITCLSFAFGNLDKFGYTDSPVFATNSGTLVGSLNDGGATTNYIENPSFSHDTLMNKWIYNPAELDIKRLPEAESLLDNDILVTELGANLSGVLLETSITGVTGDFFLFFLAKRFDGGEPNITITFNGANQATTKIKSQFDDYYLVFAKFTAVADFTCGANVAFNSQVIIAHAQLAKGNTNDTHPYPLIANGDLAGYQWQGVRHDSRTVYNGLSFLREGIKYADVDWLESDFTMVMWATPLWGIPLNSADAQIFRYESPYSSLQFNISSIAFGQPFLEFSMTGAAGFAAPITINYSEPIMFAFQKSGATFNLYVNGQLFFTPPVPLSPKDVVSPGTLEIGKDSNMIFDGLKIFDSSLSPDSILNLYNQELPTKSAGKALSNGIPCFFSEANGRVGSMVGFNTLASSTVTSRNTIIVLGSVGDGSADIEMELESTDSIFTNRLVTTTIPSPKQVLYEGNFYLDFQGATEFNPNNGYAVNMEYTSFRLVAGAFPQNSLQPGETFTTSFSVGGGGQQVYNQFPIATQRPKMLASEYAAMVRFLHVSSTDPNGNFTSELVFGYGSDLESIYQRIEHGDLAYESGGSANYALMTYMDGATLKNMLRQGPNALNFGMRFINNDVNQTFLALDVIHVVLKPKEFLFDGYTATGQKLVIATGKPVLTVNADSYSSEIGDLVSNTPFIAQPDKYIYMPFDFSQKTFNQRIRGQAEQIRKKVSVSLWLRPSYKF